MPVRQQLCTCIMATFRSEWVDYPIYSVPWLLISWRYEERGIGPFLMIYFIISYDILQSQQQMAFLNILGSTSSRLRFCPFVYDLHFTKLWNTARWQEPAYE